MYDPNKEKEEIALGQKAGELARKSTADLCKEVGLTPQLVLGAIRDGCTANEVVARFSEKESQFAYSKPMVDHHTRLKAADLGAAILELKPKQDKETGTVRILIESNVP